MTNRITLTALVYALALSTADCGTPRVWNSANGNFTVEASIDELGDDSVTLRKKNAKLIVVPIGKLSERDIAFIKQMRASAFSIKGLGSISAPVKGFSWRRAGDLDTPHGKAHIFMCKRGTEYDGLVLTIVPYDEARGMSKTDRARESYDSTVDFFSQGKGTTKNASPPIFIEGQKDIANSSFTAASGSAPDRTVMLRHVFSADRLYVYMAITEDAEGAERLLIASQTLIEDRRVQVGNQ